MRKLITVMVAILAISSSVNCAGFDSLIDEARTKAKSGDLDGAITICKNIINSHPGAPFEPRARAVLGYILTKKKVPVADIIDQFTQIKNQFPSSPEAPEALLRIGYLRDRDKTNPAEWQQLVDKYPDTKEAAEALHCLGHMALRKGDLQTALEKFKASAALPEADSECAEDSNLEIAYAYIGQYWTAPTANPLPEAINRFNDIKSKYTRQDSLIKARMGLGEIYLIQGYGSKAAEEYKAVLDSSSADSYTRSVAQFEYACALYAQQDWDAAITAFDEYLSGCAGQTLIEKDRLWKLQRPGYSDLVFVDSAKANTLTGVELVPAASYWKAHALFNLGHYSECKTLVDSLLIDFPAVKIGWKIKSLNKMCADILQEVK